MKKRKNKGVDERQYLQNFMLLEVKEYCKKNKMEIVYYEFNGYGVDVITDNKEMYSFRAISKNAKNQQTVQWQRLLSRTQTKIMRKIRIEYEPIKHMLFIYTRKKIKYYRSIEKDITNINIP